MDRAERLAYVKETLCCPHCEQELDRWDVPLNPMSTWSADFIYVCENRECPYYLESYRALAEQGVAGGAYCFVFDPSRDWCGPMAARIPKNPRG